MELGAIKRKSGSGGNWTAERRIFVQKNGVEEGWKVVKLSGKDSNEQWNEDGNKMS